VLNLCWDCDGVVRLSGALPCHRYDSSRGKWPISWLREHQPHVDGNNSNRRPPVELRWARERPPVPTELEELCWSCAGVVLRLCWSCAGVVMERRLWPSWSHGTLRSSDTKAC
jgi:hypothetical protein